MRTPDTPFACETAEEQLHLDITSARTSLRLLPAGDQLSIRLIGQRLAQLEALATELGIEVPE
jgi:hypothetical protein